MRIWKRNDGEHIARYSERHRGKGSPRVDICNNALMPSIHDHTTGLV